MRIAEAFGDSQNEPKFGGYPPRHEDNDFVFKEDASNALRNMTAKDNKRESQDLYRDSEIRRSSQGVRDSKSSIMNDDGGRGYEQDMYKESLRELKQDVRGLETEIPVVRKENNSNAKVQNLVRGSFEEKYGQSTSQNYEYGGDPMKESVAKELMRKSSQKADVENFVPNRSDVSRVSVPEGKNAQASTKYIEEKPNRQGGASNIGSQQTKEITRYEDDIRRSQNMPAVNEHSQKAREEPVQKASRGGEARSDDKVKLQWEISSQIKRFQLDKENEKKKKEEDALRAKQKILSQLRGKGVEPEATAPNKSAAQVLKKNDQGIEHNVVKHPERQRDQAKANEQEKVSIRESKELHSSKRLDKQADVMRSSGQDKHLIRESQEYGLSKQRGSDKTKDRDDASIRESMNIDLSKQLGWQKEPGAVNDWDRNFMKESRDFNQSRQLDWQKELGKPNERDKDLIRDSRDFNLSKQLDWQKDVRRAPNTVPKDYVEKDYGSDEQDEEAHEEHEDNNYDQEENEEPEDKEHYDEEDYDQQDQYEQEDQEERYEEEDEPEPYDEEEYEEEVVQPVEEQPRRVESNSRLNLKTINEPERQHVNNYVDSRYDKQKPDNLKKSFDYPQDEPESYQPQSYAQLHARGASNQNQSSKKVTGNFGVEDSGSSQLRRETQEGYFDSKKSSKQNLYEDQGHQAGFQGYNNPPKKVVEPVQQASNPLATFGKNDFKQKDFSGYGKPQVTESPPRYYDQQERNSHGSFGARNESQDERERSVEEEEGPEDRYNQQSRSNVDRYGYNPAENEVYDYDVPTGQGKYHEEEEEPEDEANYSGHFGEEPEEGEESEEERDIQVYDNVQEARPASGYKDKIQSLRESYGHNDRNKGRWDMSKESPSYDQDSLKGLSLSKMTTTQQTLDLKTREGETESERAGEIKLKLSPVDLKKFTESQRGARLVNQTLVRNHLVGTIRRRKKIKMRRSTTEIQSRVKKRKVATGKRVRKMNRSQSRLLKLKRKIINCLCLTIRGMKSSKGKSKSTLRM